MIRVAHRIGQQVADDARQERQIAADVYRGRHHNQRQTLLARDRGVLEAQAVKHGRQRNGRDAGLHDSSVEPGDVQEGVEQLLHRIHGPAYVADDVPLPGSQRRLLQRLHEQTQGVQGLAQIVARRREKTRLRDVGALGGILLIAQLRDQPEVLEPQRDGLGDEPRQMQREGRHQREVQQHPQAGREVQGIVLAQKELRRQQDARIEECEERGHHGCGCIHAPGAHADEAHHEEQLVGQAIRDVELERADAPDQARYGRAHDGVGAPAPHLVGRRIGTVERAPLKEPSEGPQVDGSQPDRDDPRTRSGCEHDSHERGDDYGAHECRRHVAVLDADLLRFRQERPFGLCGRALLIHMKRPVVRQPPDRTISDGAAAASRFAGAPTGLHPGDTADLTHHAARANKYRGYRQSGLIKGIVPCCANLYQRA